MNNGSKVLILFGVWIWTLGHYLIVWNIHSKVILCYCIIIACTVTVMESDKIDDSIFDRMLILNKYNKLHYRKFIAFVIGFPGVFNLDFNLISLGSLMMVLGGIFRLIINDKINDSEIDNDSSYTLYDAHHYDV